MKAGTRVIAWRGVIVLQEVHGFVKRVTDDGEMLTVKTDGGETMLFRYSPNHSCYFSHHGLHPAYRQHPWELKEDKPRIVIAFAD